MFPKVFSVFSLIVAASAVRVTYDPGYDDGDRSMSVVSCSDGTNGLITRYNWQIQRNIPTFPLIGGADAVAGYNSPNCGTCWQLTYGTNTINVLAIDHAGSGFNIGQTALDRLTNNQAVALGSVDATAVQVPATVCGLPA